MNTFIAMRRTLMGLLLAAAAAPVHSQTDEAAEETETVADTIAEAVAENVADTIDAKSENWWFYLENDREREIAALLKDGADPNIADANSQPSLQRAVERDAWRVFDVLVNDPRTSLDIENPAGETPLMYLAIAGQTARAATLIHRGARVNRLGWTPLHYAASRAQLATARLLLAAGALPNAPSPQGRTPLMMAAYSGSAELVQLLLEHGADPTTRDTNGRDAADWAQQQNEQALADELRRISDERLARREDLRRSRPAGADIVDVEVFTVW